MLEILNWLHRVILFYLRSVDVKPWCTAANLNKVIKRSISYVRRSVQFSLHVVAQRSLVALVSALRQTNLNGRPIVDATTIILVCLVA